MKLLIASDIHGSAYWCERLMAAYTAENPTQLVLLGDLLYHGPRNPLPQGYDPAAVYAMLNSLDRVPLAVRGNCDSEVDQMVLDFPCMSDYAQIFDGDHLLFCTHGHLLSPQNPPRLREGDAFLSGHTHIKTNDVRDGITFFNPGSVGLPKDGTHSYGLYIDGKFELKEL